VQAVGASMNMALSTAIITEAFPDQERGKALGIIGLFVSIGVIAGPTLGGIILEHLTWHWLFFVNLPIGVIGFILVLLFVQRGGLWVIRNLIFWERVRFLLPCHAFCCLYRSFRLKGIRMPSFIFCSSPRLSWRGYSSGLSSGPMSQWSTCAFSPTGYFRRI